jgi:hypothetical protein
VIYEISLVSSVLTHFKVHEKQRQTILIIFAGFVHRNEVSLNIVYTLNPQCHSAGDQSLDRPWVWLLDPIQSLYNTEVKIRMKGRLKTFTLTLQTSNKKLQIFTQCEWSLRGQNCYMALNINWLVIRQKTGDMFHHVKMLYKWKHSQ